MKQTLSAALALFLFLGCEVNGAGESTVGSSKDTQINYLSFTIDTTFVQGSPVALVAQGKVKNIGSTATTPPWYVEATFYTDSTYTTKLGGNYATIQVSLSAGQETFWKIQFSSSNTDVRNYPNFRVLDLRGIYKN